MMGDRSAGVGRSCPRHSECQLSAKTESAGPSAPFLGRQGLMEGSAAS
jgi:hypothetical protein